MSLNTWKPILSEYSVPKSVVTDSGPCYSSEYFNEMMKRMGIHHITNSPHHHQSNGMAEGYMRIIKSLLQKAKETGDDPMLWFSFTAAHYWVILCHHHLKCFMVENPFQTYHKFSTTPPSYPILFIQKTSTRTGQSRWKHPPHRDQSNVHHTPWQNLAPSNSWRVPGISFLQNKGWQWYNICQNKATLKTIQAMHSANTKTNHTGTASSSYDATSINQSKNGTHMYGLVNSSLYRIKKKIKLSLGSE